MKYEAVASSPKVKRVDPKVKRVDLQKLKYRKIRENHVETTEKCLIPSKIAGQQPSTLAKKR